MGFLGTVFFSGSPFLCLFFGVFAVVFCGLILICSGQLSHLIVFYAFFWCVLAFFLVICLFSGPYCRFLGLFSYIYVTIDISDKYHISMKKYIIVINKEDQTGRIFTTKSSAARYMGYSGGYIRNIKPEYKDLGKYIVFFGAEIFKNEKMKRITGFK